MTMPGRRRVVFSIFALVTFMFACAELPVGHDLSKLDLGEAAKLKNEAEYWGKRIKQYNKPDPVEYRNAERRYTEASASMAAWIVQVKLNLATGAPLPDANSERRLREASENTKQFVDYVNSLLGRGVVPIDKVVSLVNVAKTLSDVMLNIAGKRKEWRDAEIKKVSDLLDSLKWQPFDTL